MPGLLLAGSQSKSPIQKTLCALQLGKHSVEVNSGVMSWWLLWNMNYSEATFETMNKFMFIFFNTLY